MSRKTRLTQEFLCPHYQIIIACRLHLNQINAILFSSHKRKKNGKNKSDYSSANNFFRCNLIISKIYFLQVFCTDKKKCWPWKSLEKQFSRVRSRMVLTLKSIFKVFFHRKCKAYKKVTPNNYESWRSEKVEMFFSSWRFLQKTNERILLY